MQVNVKTGMTFQAGLRSVLRQDPDIVLVGEVRDSETAELALKASLTGHLVLTTLHTNSAVAALTRLVDMGVQPFLVASSLTAAIAQRLVRKPCASCAAAYIRRRPSLTALGCASRTWPAPPRGAAPAARSAAAPATAAAPPSTRSSTSTPSCARCSSPTRARVAVGEAAARNGHGVAARRRRAQGHAPGQTTFEEAMRVTASDEAPATALCRSCERPLEEGMIACPWCGTSQQPAGCTSCHRPLRGEWTCCPWCATPVVPQAAAPEPARTGPVPPLHEQAPPPTWG